MKRKKSKKEEPTPSMMFTPVNSPRDAKTLALIGTFRVTDLAMQLGLGDTKEQRAALRSMNHQDRVTVVAAKLDELDRTDPAYSALKILRNEVVHLKMEMATSVPSHIWAKREERLKKDAEEERHAAREMYVERNLLQQEKDRLEKKVNELSHQFYTTMVALGVAMGAPGTSNDTRVEVIRKLLSGDS
jgi:hypothetical protein